jgi:hypothetical protein
MLLPEFRDYYQALTRLVQAENNQRPNTPEEED